jgi:hypothetical protein
MATFAAAGATAATGAPPNLLRAGVAVTAGKGQAKRPLTAEEADAQVAARGGVAGLEAAARDNSSQGGKQSMP